MITVDIARIKSYYANGTEDVSFDINVSEKNNGIIGLSYEDLIEIYRSIGAYFKEVEKEELK